MDDFGNDGCGQGREGSEEGVDLLPIDMWFFSDDFKHCLLSLFFSRVGSSNSFRLQLFLLANFQHQQSYRLDNNITSEQQYS